MSVLTALSSRGSRNCAGAVVSASLIDSPHPANCVNPVAQRAPIKEAGSEAAVVSGVRYMAGMLASRAFGALLAKVADGNPMQSSSKAQQELERIEQHIRQLESVAGANQDARRQLQHLHQQVERLRAQIYAHLHAWRITELARHPQRPYTLDYVERIFPDWSELHGDRSFGDDHAIVCGMARFHGEEVVVIGHQKGRD